MRTITKCILASTIITGGVFAYSKAYKNSWKKFDPLAFWRKMDQVNFQTTQPTRRTIVRKKVFSGNLIPHKETKLGTHITGIIDKLFVQVGDYVQPGTAIARIKIQPKPKKIEAAASKLRLASITLKQERAKHLRNKQLFGKKMLAKEAYETSLAAFEQAKEKFASAQREWEITQRGDTLAKGTNTNIIKATKKGTILSLPVKEGSIVQEMKEKASDGTVAIIGDMDRFLFSAKVSELDVVHLRKGMTCTAWLNACHNEKLQVTLTSIAPKASEEDLKKGEIKFEIEGTIHKSKKSKVALRAGYLVLAEVILERAKDVLAVPESMIQTEGTNYFVKCFSEGKSVKKGVTLGLSDGLYVEVKGGLTETDRLIVE